MHVNAKNDDVVPAVTAVLDGQLRLGLEESEYERIFTATNKVSVRDLSVAIGKGLDVGLRLSLFTRYCRCSWGKGLALEASEEFIECAHYRRYVADLHALSRFNVLCERRSRSPDLPSLLNI